MNLDDAVNDAYNKWCAGGVARGHAGAWSGFNAGYRAALSTAAPPETREIEDLSHTIHFADGMDDDPAAAPSDADKGRAALAAYEVTATCRKCGFTGGTHYPKCPNEGVGFPVALLAAPSGGVERELLAEVAPVLYGVAGIVWRCRACHGIAHHIRHSGKPCIVDRIERALSASLTKPGEDTRHYHAGPDSACARCGHDIRHQIHLRSEE